METSPLRQINNLDLKQPEQKRRKVVCFHLFSCFQSAHRTLQQLISTRRTQAPRSCCFVFRVRACVRAYIWDYEYLCVPLRWYGGIIVGAVTSELGEHVSVMSGTKGVLPGGATRQLSSSSIQRHAVLPEKMRAVGLPFVFVRRWNFTSDSHSWSRDIKAAKTSVRRLRSYSSLIWGNSFALKVSFFNGIFAILNKVAVAALCFEVLPPVSKFSSLHADVFLFLYPADSEVIYRNSDGHVIKFNIVTNETEIVLMNTTFVRLYQSVHYEDLPSCDCSDCDHLTVFVPL